MPPPTLEAPTQTFATGIVPQNDPLEKYFAKRPRSEIASQIQKKIEDYVKWLKETGRLYLFRRSFEYYNRGLIKGGRLWATGLQDEFMNMSVNHFRNILLHILSGATNQRPTFNPIASNTDYKSLAQTKISRGVLDYYNRERKLEVYVKKAGELALVYSMAFMVLGWDTELGADYVASTDGSKAIKEGDVTIDVFGPLTMAYDYALEDPAQSEWYIARRLKNKYSVAAKYPGLADKIVAQKLSANDIVDARTVGNYTSYDDLIFVDTLVHKKTAVIPNGRLVECIGSDIVTIDTGLPFDDAPVYRIAPEDVLGSNAGYSIAFDLLPIQETIDKLYSTILTNNANFGVQNIWTQPGGGISVTELGGGLNHIQAPTKPEILQLLATPQEVFSFLEKLEKVMETISGVNSVQRGNPESSLKSGSALALVASQAVQFNSNFQQSYNRLLEDVGSGLIKILAKFAKTKRMIAIAGKSNAGYVGEFSAEDLSSITRVQVEMGNPLSRTTAGKLQIAESLLEKGMLKTPQEYIQVLLTGNIEPMVEGEQSQLLLIRAENEKLSEGVGIPALVTDPHRLHILEHGVVLSSPAARSNPEVVMATLQHIQNHLGLMRTADPAILSLYGEQPLPPAVPGTLTAPQTAAIRPGPTQSAGTDQPVVDATNPILKEAAEVRLPQIPASPLAGS